jgi:uncharacterized protein YraI
MKHILSATALSLSIFATTSAFAADGYVIGNANLRTGPDSSYPPIMVLGAGTPVAIEGCVDGWSWCDVATGDNRGWVAGNYLQEEYRGQRVLVPEYGVQIGVPIVSFVFGAYWDSHYRGHSWYGERERWSHVRPHYESGTVGHNSRNYSYGNSRDRAYGAIRPTSPTPVHRAVYVTQGSNARSMQRAQQQGRPASVATLRHAVPTSTRLPERTAGHASPAQRAAAPRSATLRQRSTVHPKQVSARKPPKSETKTDQEHGH